MKSKIQLHPDSETIEGIAMIMAYFASHPEHKDELLETIQVGIESFRSPPKVFTIFNKSSKGDFVGRDEREAQRAIGSLECLRDFIRAV